MTRIRIENVVVSASLGQKLDLQSIALSLPGAEYNPQAFPGLIYRLEQPKTAILLFASGKAVCTGGKSWNQANDAVRIVTEAVRRGGQTGLKPPKIQVQNIVATSDLEAEVNLSSVGITLGLERVEYEPEQFPGLVCRLEKPRVVVLLFGSGKMVCTGARRPAELALAVDTMISELQGADLIPRRVSHPQPTAPAPPPPHHAPGASLQPEIAPRLPHVPGTLSEREVVAPE